MSRLLGLLLALLGAALALTSSLIVEQVAGTDVAWWFVTCEVLGILVMASGIWMLSEEE